MSGIDKPGVRPGGIATWIALVGGLVLFVAALLYYLGRQYLTAYYKLFGIAPGVLSFSTYDYMFSSVPIVFMVIGIIPGIVFTYISLVNWSPFGIPTGSSGKERRTAIATAVVFQLGFALTIFNYFTQLVTINLSYFDGFSVGIAIGALFVTVVWLFIYFLLFINEVPLKAGQQASFPKFVVLAMLFVYFCAITPILSDRMAERVANIDAGRLAHVTIEFGQSTSELQPSHIKTTKQIDARLLIVNNNWIYFFNSTSDNLSSRKDIVHNIGPLYSIKISDIDCIIYYNASNR